MKRISSIVAFTIAMLAGTTSFAQHSALRGNIPFDFVVGETVLPAGGYTVSYLDHHIIEVQSADRKTSVKVVAMWSPNESKSGFDLVFDKYDNLYFLHTILAPSGSSMNLNLAHGRLEQRARIREAELASPNQTIVQAE